MNVKCLKDMVRVCNRQHWFAFHRVRLSEILVLRMRSRDWRSSWSHERTADISDHCFTLVPNQAYSLNNFALWISVCILIDKFCCSCLLLWLFHIVLIHLLFSIFSDIRAEMMPDTLPDRSEVAKFDHAKLKHVETQQKEVLPTKTGAVTGLR